MNIPSEHASLRRLSEVAKVLLGQSPESRTYNDQGEGLPFLQGNAEFGERRPTHRLYCTAPHRICEKGDILLSVRAPVGATNQADQSYAIGRGLAAIRFSEEDRGYGWHALRYAVPQLDLLAQGSTFAAVSRKEIEELPIWFPDGSAKLVIATILDTLERAIEQTETLLGKQQRIKTGLMHDLLTRGLDAHGRLREPSTHQFKESALGSMPKEWSIGNLLDATDPGRQPILTGPFGADLGIKDFLPDGVPVLRIGNVQQGELDLSDLLFVSPSKAAELSRYKVRNGDLLFARQGASTGRNALATEIVDGWLINYHIIRVALDHSRCAPLYIEAAFNSDSVRRQVDREKGRGTREGINTAQLKALKLKLAPVEEQREIAKVLAASARQDLPITKALANLRRVKAGVMQDLLTGRVPVDHLLSGFPL